MGRPVRQLLSQPDDRAVTGVFVDWATETEGAICRDLHDHADDHFESGDSPGASGDGDPECDCDVEADDPITGAIDLACAESARVRALWIAVLWRGIADWVLYRNARDPRVRRIWADANSWLFKERSKGVGSFHMICLLLDREKRTMRKQIRALTEDDIERIRGRRR